MPLVTHDTTRYTNNRAEVSHQPTRQRERQMRGSPSPPFLFYNAFIISISTLCLPNGGMVPHMVPISWRQIKSRIPLDLARL